MAINQGYKHFAPPSQKTVGGYRQGFRGFTLAETLITLLVLGVVAVLTIPAMIQQISEYTLRKQNTVFEKKFAEGLSQMRVDEKLAEKYATTEAFVNEMKKYFKISAVCDKDSLANCFTDTFTATAVLNGEETAAKTFVTSNIKTAKNLVEKSTYDTDVMGIVFSDGVKMLIAVDSDCTGATSGDTTGNLYSCFGYIADVNGDKSPNTSEQDIVSNLPLIKNFGLNFEIVDNKVYTAYSCDSDNICLNPVSSSYFTKDMWLASKEFCEKKGGHLPTMEELDSIAERIYSNANCIPGTASGYASYGSCKREIVEKSPLWKALGVDLAVRSYVGLWGDKTEGRYGWYRDFGTEGSSVPGYIYGKRSNGTADNCPQFQTICIK